MQYQANISPYSFHLYQNNIFLDIKFYLVNTVNNISNFLSTDYLKEKIILSLKKDLVSLHAHISVLKLEVKNIDNQNAIDAYPTAEKDLKRFKKFFSILEKVDFFQNHSIKSTSENILLDLYSIESSIRVVAFTEKNKIESDKDLINQASIISINSLHSYNASTTI